MNPTTVSSGKISWREKMLESQQIDFLGELGADSQYAFDLEDFCSGVANYDEEMWGEKEHRE